jgi:hypothetical protein
MNYKAITRSENRIETFARWFWLIVSLVFITALVITGDWREAFYYSIGLPIGSIDVFLGILVVLLTIANILFYIKKKLF